MPRNEFEPLKPTEKLTTQTTPKPVVKAKKELKLWAVHLMSESSDHYYETFRCEEQPTDRMILTWWDKQGFGEEAESLSVQHVCEVSPFSPVLRKK